MRWYLKVHLLVDGEGSLGLVVVQDAHELRFLRKGRNRLVFGIRNDLEFGDKMCQR